MGQGVADRKKQTDRETGHLSAEDVGQRLGRRTGENKASGLRQNI